MTPPENRSRQSERALFIIGMIGVVVSVILLSFQASSRTWLAVTVSSMIAVGIGIGAVVAVVWVYSRIKFQRLRRTSLQRASSGITEDLPETDRDRIAQLLAKASSEIATEQDIPRDKVRAALFGWDGKVLRIRPGLAWNMDDSDELNIEIPVGEGSAGRAYETGEQNIAVYHNPRSDSSIRDVRQRGRVDPEMKWVISTPIFGAESHVIGVLNVDGLTFERTFEQLRRSLHSLLYWAQLAGILLGAATEEHG